MTTKTGIVIDEKGTNAPLPAWPFPATANGSVAKFGGAVKTLLETGSYYHEQNSKVYNHSRAALANGTDVIGNGLLLPNNDARRAEANRRLAKARQTKETVLLEVSKLLGQRDALRPFDPNPNPLHSEMRAMARSMSPEQRAQLIKEDPDFREAVLSAKPWMSGMEASLHTELYKQALQARHGALLEELDAGIDAGSRALEVHGVVERALNNELTVVGAPSPTITPDDKVQPVELFVPKV